MARRPSSKRSFGAMAMARRISAVHRSKRNAHAVPAALGTSSGFRFSSRPMAAPYLKQIETESGIWFREARKATNQRRALVDWPTPEGLKGQLDIDRDKQAKR
jgi:hypothetical protein